MMYIFQGTVMLAVIFSDIHWGWADNQLLSGLIGAVIASILTLWWAKWQDRKYKPDNVQLPAHIEQMIEDGVEKQLLEAKPVYKKSAIFYFWVPVALLLVMVIYTEFFMD